MTQITGGCLCGAVRYSTGSSRSGPQHPMPLYNMTAAFGHSIRGDYGVPSR